MTENLLGDSMVVTFFIHVELRGHITFHVYVLAPKSGAEGNLKAHLKIMP